MYHRWTGGRNAVHRWRHFGPPHHISHVQSLLPPYALPSPTFPFPHLAGLAGRAPIGGAREVALACFVAARLAADCTGTGADVAGRTARSVGAKAWLGTLALPPVVRAPLFRCVESTAEGSARVVGQELAEVAAAGGAYLDPGSRLELDTLVATLRA